MSTFSLPPELEKIHQRLLKVRTQDDLSLRPSKYLRETFVGFDGIERPLVLRHYQIQMILHMMAMSRFVNGDDTGLGKSLEAIATMCYIWEKTPDQKVVVFTTKSAIGQWADEFARFTQGIRVIMCRGVPDKRENARAKFMSASGPTVLVQGYRSAIRDFADMQDWENFIIVFDEATAFKNPKTQVHQVCKHLADKAIRAYGLTATLIKNQLLEGFGIYRVIKPDMFPTKKKFLVQYCITRLQKIPKKKFKIPIVVGHSRSQIALFKEQISPFFLGRPKHEVASELPVLTISQMRVNLSHEQARQYANALVGLLQVGVGDSAEIKNPTMLTAIIYCQEIANHLCLIDQEGPSEKLDALISLLTEGDLADENVIVYTRFRKMVDYVMPLLKKKKVKAVRITGSENEKQRSDAMQKFQHPDNPERVMLLTAAGGESINLQSAKAMIFFDSPWSAGDYLQLLGRMIRIGSLHDRVFAIHLIAKATVDVRVMEVLRKKMKLIEAVLGKRIKGEEEADIEIRVEDEISDIFSGLRKDALSKEA